MTLQAIRRYYEAPLETAAAALSIPVRHSNELASDNDAADEFMLVRLQFGLMSDPTLCGAIEDIRGSLIVEYFGPKGKGPGRAQTVMTEMLRALHSLAARPAERVNGVLGTASTVTGPDFTALDEQPYFFSRVTAALRASYKT